MRKHIGAILFFIAAVLCLGSYREASAAETEIDSKNFPNGSADKNMDYYRTPKGVFICILKNKNQLH